MIRLLLTALALTGVPALPAMAANLFDSCDEGRMVSVGQVAAAVDCLTQKIVPGELVVNNEQLEQMQQALEQMARVVAAPGQRMGLPIGLMPQVYPGIQELPQGKVVMLSNGSGYSAPTIVGTIYPYELRITIDNNGKPDQAIQIVRRIGDCTSPQRNMAIYPRSLGAIKSHESGVSSFSIEMPYRCKTSWLLIRTSPKVRFSLMFLVDFEMELMNAFFSSA